MFASTCAGWIGCEEAQATLLDYWRQVLPESAPTLRDGGTDGQSDNSQQFWSFLSAHFASHGAEFAPSGAPCAANIIGALHQLPDGKYLICPRRKLLDAFCAWLERKGVPGPKCEGHWETRMQTAILDWGIPLKTEGADVTWRFAFYRKNQAPQGEKEKLPCLAFPLIHLPVEVQNSLRGAFGEAFEPFSAAHEGQIVPEQKSAPDFIATSSQ